MAKHFEFIKTKGDIYNGPSRCSTYLYIGEHVVFSFSCAAKYVKFFSAYVAFTDRGRMLFVNENDGDVSCYNIYKSDAQEIAWSSWESGKWIFKEEWSEMVFKGYEFHFDGHITKRNELLKCLQNTIKEYGR